MKIRELAVSTLAVVFATGLLAGCAAGSSGNQPASGQAADSKTVNVYTARHYEADDQLFESFTKATGIKVNVVKGTAEELIERLKREGESTEADLFMTVDGGVLNTAKEAGVLQPTMTDTIDKQVPKELRDKDNAWVGLATRARVIIYAKDRVKPEQLSTYEDLTSDKWKGKVLVRSSTSLYNQSLLASFIALNGEQKALEWAQGIVKNMARPPEGADRDQAKAIAAGIGDVALVNTYYVGLLINSKDPEEVKVGKSVGVFFPNQSTTGTHINISGVGLTKYSKHKENALKLVEYLTGKEAQSKLSQLNYEYPVNPEAEPAELLKSWGAFKSQQLDFAKLGEYNKKAVELLNKAGWK